MCITLGTSSLGSAKHCFQAARSAKFANANRASARKKSAAKASTGYNFKMEPDLPGYEAFE